MYAHTSREPPYASPKLFHIAGCTLRKYSYICIHWQCDMAQNNFCRYYAWMWCNKLRAGANTLRINQHIHKKYRRERKVCQTRSMSIVIRIFFACVHPLTIYLYILYGPCGRYTYFPFSYVLYNYTHFLSTIARARFNLNENCLGRGAIDR